MTRILIVEDNRDLALGLRNNLEMEGYQVDCARDGQHGLNMLEQNSDEEKFEIVILDLMMPNMGGFEFLRQLNALQLNPMVLILSAKDTEMDKVTGLRLGADDFLTKPFGLMELLARIEALVRRKTRNTSDSAAKTNCKIDHLNVDFLSRRVFCSDIEVELSPKEFELLQELIKLRGQVVSRIDLMKNVWGHSAVIESRTVDTHIGELRKKIEIDCANPTIIKTVRKIGYRIDD